MVMGGFEFSGGNQVQLTVEAALVVVGILAPRVGSWLGSHASSCDNLAAPLGHQPTLIL